MTDGLEPMAHDDAGAPLWEWACAARDIIREALDRDGIVLLRSFQTPELDLSQRLVELLGGALMEDVFWSTPRSRVTDKTFTATEYPQREEIPLHSEMSYLPTYPRLLCFHAIRCGSAGGETTIADLDAVSKDLGEITTEFHARGVSYVRVLRDGLDVPIATAFGTDDPATIAGIAAEQGMRIEKEPDGAIRLTYSGRGALSTADHPVWFNQMHISHPARLPESSRSNLVYLFGERGLPRQAFYGDGQAIPDEVVHQVNEKFARHARAIRWQPSDVVLVDNLRFAHGRRPFTGERRLHVAVGGPCRGGSRGSFRDACPDSSPVVRDQDSCDDAGKAS